MRAVRSVLRAVRAGLDSFADLMRSVVRALVTLVRQCIHWMRDAVEIGIRMLRRIAECFYDGVRSLLRGLVRAVLFLAMMRWSTSRLRADSAEAVTHSPHLRRTSRQWFDVLFPLAGLLATASNTKQEREAPSHPRRGSAHAVHGNRFLRRKKYVAGIYVGQVAGDQMKIQKVPLHEADDPNILQRMQQIGWQTRTRTRRLS